MECLLVIRNVGLKKGLLESLGSSLQLPAPCSFFVDTAEIILRLFCYSGKFELWHLHSSEISSIPRAIDADQCHKVRNQSFLSVPICRWHDVEMKLEILQKTRSAHNSILLTTLNVPWLPTQASNSHDIEESSLRQILHSTIPLARPCYPIVTLLPIESEWTEVTFFQEQRWFYDCSRYPPTPSDVIGQGW
ncbi:uncharacterized protein BT62DRAFT_626803 [Guyanagaster necrorhizus]|uniref:Uncharacterized protein n=1 Tax=Guyanagaster necrorhizus TaxID=856835 RepID=A0A9P7VGQ7_9AGAR|nr:uncharacterized protein BT62DRAFT_626803 [Guyanagaster necrorhizus MCA 3950]KAG7440409.1 hypothetical protein BT62DRAFT_626803 [Guyanagaster necrorhizus MCA 3950]